MAELNLEAALTELLARAGVALHEAVTDGPFAQSQKLVPRASNALAESGKVSGPVIEGDTVTVIASYGNASDDTGEYGIIQHERTDLQHPNGGQAKFLELPSLAFAPTMAAEVAARMR